MILYILLFVFAIALSGFFSGNETGLYRVPRVRLVLDGLTGKLTPRFLLYLANHPPLFVATVLVGNNIANYLTSFAVVLIVPYLISQSQSASELAASIASTPIVFVFGELLPKYLYFQAPYRLLKLSSPLLMIVTILFLPISLLLVALGNLLTSFTGKTPFSAEHTFGERRSLSKCFGKDVILDYWSSRSREQLKTCGRWVNDLPKHLRWPLIGWLAFKLMLPPKSR